MSGTLFSLYGYRIDSSSKEYACVVIAPAQPPNKSMINISYFHCAAGNFHQALFRKATGQQGIAFDGGLQACKRCSMTKGLVEGITQSTRARADKKLERVFVKSSGEKSVHSHTWVHSMYHKSDVPGIFENFLADTRVDGAPSMVVIVYQMTVASFAGGTLQTCVDQEVPSR